MHEVPPTRPSDLDPLTEAILDRLRQYPETQAIVLGGYLALKHYLDYRTTHDIDAWWATDAGPEVREEALACVRQAVDAVAREHGLDTAERRWGDLVSIELRRPADNHAVFSVQIATRTRELASPQASPWAPVRIETLADNLGSKMTALVDRGAPRDFSDIYEAVKNNLATVEDLWSLWRRKNPDLDMDAARAQVLRHLAALEARRPLTHVPVAQNERASRVRAWIRVTLTSAHEHRDEERA